MSLKDTDVRTLGDKAIAKKFKLSLARVRKLVDAGAKHEKEHNTNLAKAKEVARDHIGERPDYYKMLSKAEKTDKNVMKEDTGVGGVRGLGYVSGDPAGVTDYVGQYINTNAMAYYDENGNKLDYLKKQHYNLHNSKLGYPAFDPTKIGANKNFIKEAKLNELGEYDNKGGMPGYEGTSAPIRAIRKRDVKEQSPANPSYKERPMYEKSTGKMPADMTDATARGIYQEEDNTKPDVNLMGNQKPDAYGYGAKGTTKTIHEETKMDNKELINEALDCILEDNLPEMKDNLMKALQEKAMEKLEERKKEIAANYFAQ
jgi:hypothetical protein